MQSALHSDSSLAKEKETYKCINTTFSVDFILLFSVIHMIIENRELDCFLKLIFYMVYVCDRLKTDFLLSTSDWEI